MGGWALVVFGAGGEEFGVEVDGSRHIVCTGLQISIYFPPQEVEQG